MFHQASLLFTALILLMGGAWYGLHSMAENDAGASAHAERRPIETGVSLSAHSDRRAINEIR